MPPEPLRKPPGRPPLDEYNERLAALRETHQKWMRLDEGLALWVRVLPFWWLGLPALVFMTLVVRHDQVVRARDATAMSITFYERGVARAGEDALAAWLTQAAAVAEIRGRQETVEELRGRLNLREAFALAGAEIRGAVDTTALASWATATPTLTGVWPRVAR